MSRGDEQTHHDISTAGIGIQSFHRSDSLFNIDRLSVYLSTNQPINLPTSASLFPSNKHKGSGIIVSNEDDDGDNEKDGDNIAVVVAAAAASSRMGNCHTRTSNRARTCRIGCVNVNECSGGDGGVGGSTEATRAGAMVGLGFTSLLVSL